MHEGWEGGWWMMVTWCWRYDEQERTTKGTRVHQTGTAVLARQPEWRRRSWCSSAGAQPAPSSPLSWLKHTETHTTSVEPRYCGSLCCPAVPAPASPLHTSLMISITNHTNQYCTTLFDLRCPRNWLLLLWFITSGAVDRHNQREWSATRITGL